MDLVVGCRLQVRNHDNNWAMSYFSFNPLHKIPILKMQTLTPFRLRHLNLTTLQHPIIIHTVHYPCINKHTITKESLALGLWIGISSYKVKGSSITMDNKLLLKKDN